MRLSLPRIGPLMIVAVATAYFDAPARAQSAVLPAAEQLFRDAHGLLARGEVEEACVKFGESQRLDPAIGTLLNLAICHEKAGRLASAWAEYADVAGLAARAGQRAREAFARGKVAELEPRLARLLIAMPPMSTNDVVTLDGSALSAEALATALPIDPGSHLVVVQRHDEGRWERAIVIEPGSATVRVEVPPPPEPEIVTPTSMAPAPAAHRAPGLSPLRWAAVGAGAAGVVATSFSVVYAFTSASRARGATASRSLGDDVATAQFEDQAKLLRNYAFVSGAIAVVCLGAGVTLWLAPSKKAAASSTSFELIPRIGLRNAMLDLNFTF